MSDILEPVDKWEAVLKVDGVALRNILATLPSALKEEVAKTKEIDKRSTSLSVKKGSLDTEDDFEVTE